jgi:cellulose synthase/poly-beta-1,6-N-acetylglucosamine synthase-like glycosyltransferase
MTIVAATLFWGAAGLLAYHFVGFPLIMLALARLRPRPVRREPITPRVTMIIAAYNEESVIAAKCENTLALDYPPGMLEVIIAADGSSDRTVSIAQGYAERGIVVMHEPERRGKTAAINRAAARATGEILFFSDANTVYAPDTIRMLMRSFADSEVGAVSGRKVILEHGQRHASRGETAFWGYEVMLKQSESVVGSIVTADGEIFAVRRDVFEPIPAGVVHDDMYLTLRIVDQGRRVVMDPDAVSAEHASKSLLDEFHLKVRYASAGYQILAMFRHMLLPPRSWFAVQFLSHKVLRWTAWMLLIILFVANAFLPGAFYRTLFWMQVVFYAAAAIGWMTHGRIKIGALYFPLYFVMGNSAGMYGFGRWLRRGQTTQWRRAER